MDEIKSATGRGRPAGIVKIPFNSKCEQLICEETINGKSRPAIKRDVKEELGIDVSMTTIWKVQSRLVLRTEEIR